MPGVSRAAAALRGPRVGAKSRMIHIPAYISRVPIVRGVVRLLITAYSRLFKGRYSLHRVTPLSGAQVRYVAIFSFVEEPGMVGSPERTRQLYGRVLPVHLERQGLRADALID